MNEIHLIIPGAPIAKKRPRFVRRGKFVGTYNPQETEEGKWLWLAQGQIAERIDEGPIEIIMIFTMQIPASVSEKKRLSLMYQPHVKKPDIDNLQKFSLDCLNGVLFRDDSQIHKITAVKRYGIDPGTEITAKW